MQDAHVVVVGGGIGGLALAIALTRDSIPVAVHEQARQFATWATR